MKRALTFACACLLAFPALAHAAPQQDSVKGHGTNFSGQGFAFSATSTATGFDAQGSVRLDFGTVQGTVTISGDVTCLDVVGGTAASPATATIWGRITRVQPPSNNLAQFPTFVVSATDSGKFGSGFDTEIHGVSSAPPPPDGACPSSFTGSPISSGDIVIENAFP